eukprot:m.381880 g.381880  ORF g.381880 m.381880 type:complete len:69 (+) comp56242_c0_seq80:347-553(+)
MVSFRPTPSLCLVCSKVLGIQLSPTETSVNVTWTPLYFEWEHQHRLLYSHLLVFPIQVFCARVLTFFG